MHARSRLAHRPIRSHLVRHAEGLPTDVVSFLLRTSILESLSADLCRTVANMPQADTIFESLVARQLLLAPLDAEGFWYRCHPLLRSFLQHRLEAEFPESLGELHRRAYAWYAGEHRWTDAIRHAIAVGDAAEAVVWIEKCAMALLKRGELLALLTWERIVPPELMRRQVKARLAIAWGMALAMRFDEASALAAQIETELGETDPVTREAIGCDCQTIRAVALALSDRVEGGLAPGRGQPAAPRQRAMDDQCRGQRGLDRLVETRRDRALLQSFPGSPRPRTTVEATSWRRSFASASRGWSSTSSSIRRTHGATSTRRCAWRPSMPGRIPPRPRSLPPWSRNTSTTREGSTRQRRCWRIGCR